jgi:hypothetical protein
MASKLVSSGAVQADADLCNAIDPPVSGCHAGGGIHVVIPPDFVARIQGGQSVPGCTYYAIVSGGLFVTDRAVSLLGNGPFVSGLLPGQQAQAALLNVKLSTAQVVP